MESLLKVVESELHRINERHGLQEGLCTRGPLGASMYKGVCVTRNNLWRAAIYINGQQIYLGTYVSEEEAAKKYDSAARHFFYFPRRLNFPWVQE